MSENFKVIVVGAAIAGATAIAQALVTFDPATITDWGTWAVGLTAAFVRQAAVYIVSKVSADSVTE